MSTDKEFFEKDKTLASIINKPSAEKEYQTQLKYQEIMSKPLLSGKDLMELPYQPNDYLIENFLWRNDVAFIIAQAKVGKSIFSSQMACSLTCGEAFLGQFDVVKPLNIIYVQAEGTLYDTQERLRSTVSTKEVNWNPDKWRHFFPPALSLDSEDGYNDFVERIERSEFLPDVIFIDPLYMAMRGKLSDDERARCFCRGVRRLQERFKCSVIIIHHEHKPVRADGGFFIEEGDGAIFGSFVWKAFASHVLRMTVNKKNKVRKLTCGTQRSGALLEELELELIENPLLFRVASSKSSPAINKTIYETIKSSTKPISAAEVIKITEFSPSTVRHTFTQLKKDGKIVKSGSDGRKILYKAKDE